MISSVNSNNQNFTGRFVVKGKISPQNMEILERFKNYTLDGVSNKAFLAKKNFNVYVDNAVDNRVHQATPLDTNRLILFSRFRFFESPSQSNIILRRYADNPKLTDKTKQLVILNPRNENLEGQTRRFRDELRGMEDSKIFYFGFNSPFELIGNCIRGLISSLKN